MLTAACVNWSDYLGRGDEYVARLKAGLAKHLTIPHEFRCFTDLEGPGWWAKVELFKPGLFEGDVIYFDLDVMIQRNIDHLVTLAATDRTKVWMRDDFSYPYGEGRKVLNPQMERMLGGPGCCNSSVMIWHGDTMAPVWNAWSSRRDEILKTLHGDQNLIGQVMLPGSVGFLPRRSIQSYRYGTERRTAEVLVFHGNPKPHELCPTDELRVKWESAQ